MSGQSTDLDLFGSMEGNTTSLKGFFTQKYYPVSHAGGNYAHAKSFPAKPYQGSVSCFVFDQPGRGW